MEIGKYKQMMKYLTRKKTNFDRVVYDPNFPDNSNVIVDNGNIKTENQLKAEIKSEKKIPISKPNLQPLVKPERLYDNLIKYDGVNADEVMVKYDSTTGLFSNADKSMAFKNVADARKWNSNFEKYSDTYKEMNDEVKPKVKPVAKPVVKTPVKPSVKPTVTPTTSPVNIDFRLPLDYEPYRRTPQEIEQEKNFLKILEQREQERITRENSGLNALVPRVFGNSRKNRKE